MTKIIKPVYFANWADIWAFPLTNMIAPIVSKIHFLTPNVITIISFCLYLIGSVSLFLNYQYHLIVASLFLLLGYIGDDLDGQVARTRQLSSIFGDYLDKVLDFLKIYILTASLSYAVYLQTQNILSIYLGFTACFFFNYRYYIKLETMFSSMTRNDQYLKLSAVKRDNIEKELDLLHEKLWKSPMGKLKSLWLKNRAIFFADEAEFAVFTSLGALFDKLEIVLWILAVSQIAIAFWRFYERGHQLHISSKKLLLPMRK